MTSNSQDIHDYVDALHEAVVLQKKQAAEQTVRLAKTLSGPGWRLRKLWRTIRKRTDDR